MKTAQQISENYEKTGVLVLPQEGATIRGRGPSDPGTMDITFADGSTLILTVTRYLTGLAAGRDSVGVYWGDD
ncbi:hypothetical protein [Comamonas thiooxydans]|uniref:hypothetical protein n=1 Tax=Comamonas thiooxydans TaxID=363952 RepID=UPI00103D76D3|nr:hypothetical protein [Comamonas thiooxydans]